MGRARSSANPAAAAVAEAKAILDNANAEVLQRKSLAESEDISHADFNRSQQAAQLAQLRLDKATVNASSLHSPARLDDPPAPRASLRAAQQQLAESRIMLGKTVIRAPFAGMVLKIYHHAGDAVSPSDAIVSFGDTSSGSMSTKPMSPKFVSASQPTSRPRHLAPGAFPPPFLISVVSLAGKNVKSGDPQEKADTKILETIVSLDGHPPLPVGLRVDAFIETPPDWGIDELYEDAVLCSQRISYHAWPSRHRLQTPLSRNLSEFSLRMS